MYSFVAVVQALQRQWWLRPAADAAASPEAEADPWYGYYGYGYRPYGYGYYGYRPYGYAYWG